MTAKEIKKYNRSIAYFMALKNEDGSLHENDRGGYSKGTLHFGSDCNCVNYLLPIEAEYHDEWWGQWDRNWQWLMCVVEKIESIGAQVDIYLNQCSVTFYHFYSTRTVGASSKIAAVYSQVVAFIEWHNEQVAANPNLLTKP